MRIVTLIENTPGDPRCACEHGLSLYLETHDHRLLMDTGSTGAFADNAEALGIDLTDVELVHVTGIPPALSQMAIEATVRLMERA